MVTGAQWQSVNRVNWQSSSAVDGGAEGRAFFDIHVYPCLLAPCRIDLLAGWTLAEAFSRTVLGDPEVVALGREAVRVSPAFEAVFIKGHCQTTLRYKEWPLAFERWPMASTVHPDSARRSKFDAAREPDPLEVVIATEALKHRYCALISVLRRGELECRGLAARQGDPNIVPRSIWSHPNFYCDASNGDVLQDDQESVARYHILMKRWFGVVLHKPDPKVHAFDAIFHGKPIARDELPPTASESQKTPAQRSKTQANVETKANSYNDCVAWLKTVISKNPNKRTSKAVLWAEAHRQWPGTLSRRMFEDARTEAIRSTFGASAWAAAGRPRKS